MHTRKESRRQFLRTAGGVAAGALGASIIGCNAGGKEQQASANMQKPAPQGKRPSRATVVIARDPGMWKGETLDDARVQALLMKAVRELSGEKSDSKAWGRYFRETDRVAVKVNCLAGRKLSTTPELIRGIIGGLRAAGVAQDRIFVFDRTGAELERAGFQLNLSGKGPRVLGTDAQGMGYENELSLFGEAGSRVSRIVSRYSDALISAPVLKDHDLCGLSGCMKNMFGAIHNPNKMHPDNCDPYIADCFSLPEFSGRARLFICDAAIAQYHGGPGYKPAHTWKFSGVIVSDDPVALDAVCLDIIEKKRRDKGLPTLAKEGRPAKFIRTAADGAHRLGVASLKNITIRNLNA